MGENIRISLRGIWSHKMRSFLTMLGIIIGIAAIIAIVSMIQGTNEQIKQNLVGGIGVMNIMLVSVTERTREIGLKKALGAKKRTIRTQFLTEAALLSMIGGALGVIVGIILAQLIAYVARMPVAVGILFGLMPSARAANLNPYE